MWDVGSHVKKTTMPGKDFKTLICVHDSKSTEGYSPWNHLNSIISRTNPRLSCSARQARWQVLMFAVLSTFATIYQQREGEKNNTEVVSLLVNLTDFIICSSSKKKKKHLCWQFSVCFPLAELYISLFARSDSAGTKLPGLTDMWVLTTNWSTVLVKKKKNARAYRLPPSFSSFLFCSTSPHFHSHFIWLCTTKSESEPQVSERLAALKI